jgi:hypothetical protein
MVQVQILSGRNAGTTHRIQAFPFRVGRGGKADLRLEEPGIWESHLQLDLARSREITLTVLPDARAAVNGLVVQSPAPLKNGDLIQAGSVEMRFSLSSARQYSTSLREALTWIGLGILCLGQIALIYALL